ncbi:MAG TPA: efflux RND transporter periplasmic adaptor subunit [Rhizobiaceae bacterium]|nr:efflux RND transporter periplasmic adaptor subunit [Rhizobiaceae bacterium]
MDFHQIISIAKPRTLLLSRIPLLPLLAIGGAFSPTAAFAQQRPPAPPPAVTVAKVAKENVTPTYTTIGRVQAIQSVQIHAMVQGILQQVAFQEGSDIKEGQLLFVIQPDIYDAQVKSAEAALAKAQAALKNDQLTVARDQDLVKRGATPQATLDEAVATRDADQANVEAAQAQIETARINLGYTRITAPISGRIGAAAVTKGNLVDSTTGALATLVQLDPIRVVFSVDQSQLVTAEQKRGTSIQQLTQEFLPRIQLSNGTMYDQPGKLAFVSNQVDQATGTIPIYAEFPNPRKLLLPGQYVNIVIRPSKADEELVVPIAAVQQDSQGKFVLVVGPDKKVSEERIQATRQAGQNWIVTSGLKEGQTIIVQGVQKARAGQVVNPQPAQASPGGSDSTAKPLSTGQ